SRRIRHASYSRDWSSDVCSSDLHIWRVKEASDVLPLVPVTATIVAGCAPKKRAASSASTRRGSSTSKTGTGADTLPPRRVTIAEIGRASWRESAGRLVVKAG